MSRPLPCFGSAISSPCAAFKQESENHPERRYHEFNGNCYLFVSDLQRLRWARDNERSRDHCQVSLDMTSYIKILTRLQAHGDFQLTYQQIAME